MGSAGGRCNHPVPVGRGAQMPHRRRLGHAPRGTAIIDVPKNARTGLRFTVGTAPIVRPMFGLAPDDVPRLAAQVTSDWRTRAT